MGKFWDHHDKTTQGYIYPFATDIPIFQSHCGILSQDRMRPIILVLRKADCPASPRIVRIERGSCNHINFPEAVVLDYNNMFSEFSADRVAGAVDIYFNGVVKWIQPIDPYICTKA